MQVHPLPKVEHDRLRALHVLDQGEPRPEADPDLDALVRTAALICGVPISLVSLVGEDRQWFRANFGLDGVFGSSREVSFCAHSIQADDVFVVEDATKDPRFAQNPLVTGDPAIRFYAGAPLRMSNGGNAGALCVIDRVPRVLDDRQKAALANLATVVVHVLENKRLATDYAMVAAELRGLQDAAPLGFFATDPSGSCTHVNPKWQEIYGLTLPESLGDGWSKAIHPDDRALVFAEWTRAAGLNQAFDAEFRILRPDTTERRVRSISRVLRNPAGLLTGHVGAVEDVTERHEAAQKLAAKRAKIEAILHATGSATYEWNLQTGETRVDAGWARMTGNKLTDFGTVDVHTWSAQIHPDDRPKVQTAFQNHFQNPETPFDFEVRKQHVDGHWVCLLNRGRVTSFTPDGKPEWVFGVQIDITERKRQEEALLQSRRLLEKTGMAAGVGGWELDLRSNALTWTDQTRLIHGLPLDFQPDVEKAFDFYAPTSRPLISNAIEQGIAEGKAWDLELQLIRADGTLIWVRAVGDVEFSDGKPIRLYGAFQDISDRVSRQQELQQEHRRLTLATDSGGIGVWQSGVDTDTLVWDAQMYRLYGCDGQSHLPALAIWDSAMDPAEADRVNQELARAVKSGTRFDTEFEIIWPDGSRHDIRAMADLTTDPLTGAKVLLGVNWDVTPLRALATRLSNQYDLMRVTLRSIGDAVITTDAKGTVTSMNPVAEVMTGWTMRDADTKPLRDIFNVLNEKTLQSVENPVETAMARRAPVGHAAGTILISRTGQEFGIEESAAPILDDAGAMHGVVLVFHDVTAERRLNGEMAYRATHDPLTGCTNRAEFDQRLGDLLTRPADAASHQMLYIDLDHFKQVNDACGHAAGDEVLVQVSKIIREQIRAQDTLARYGGDEFAVLLQHCPTEVGQRIAEKICARMEMYRYTTGDRRLRIGASIGLVPVHHSWASVDAIIAAADTCCLSAKASGRNRVHVWQPTDRAAAARKADLQWAARLEQALTDDRFVLLAQQVLPLKTDRPGLHADLHLRLVEKDGSLILPALFLPLAERFNLSPRIDLAVLRLAVAAFADLGPLSDIAMIRVDLTARSVADPAFHRQAIDLLAKAGPEICRRLSLEMAEAAAITNLPEATDFVAQLHKLGIRATLGDFGAGTAALGYLRGLKADSLKIDAQFSKSLAKDPMARAMLRCFVEVAQTLGIPTTAVAVDDPATLFALRNLGVDFAQGPLIGQPVAIGDLSRTLSRSAV